MINNGYKISKLKIHEWKLQNRTVENAASGIAMVTTMPIPESRRRNFGGLVFAVCCSRTIHPAAKVSEEANINCPAIGTRRYNFQLPIPAPSAKYTALGLQTDRQTDGQRKVNAKSRSYCVLYDRLKTTDKSHLEHAVNLYKFKITVKQRLGLGNKFGKVACAGSYRNAQRFWTLLPRSQSDSHELDKWMNKSDTSSIGWMFPRRLNTSSVWWCTGVCRTGTSLPRWSPHPASDAAPRRGRLYDLPTGTVSLCLAVDSAPTAVRRSTMPARQSGTRCLMNF